MFIKSASLFRSGIIKVRSIFSLPFAVFPLHFHPLQLFVCLKCTNIVYNCVSQLFQCDCDRLFICAFSIHADTFSIHAISINCLLSYYFREIWNDEISLMLCLLFRCLIFISIMCACINAALYIFCWLRISYAHT